MALQVNVAILKWRIKDCRGAVGGPTAAKVWPIGNDLAPLAILDLSDPTVARHSNETLSAQLGQGTIAVGNAETKHIAFDFLQEWQMEAAGACEVDDLQLRAHLQEKMRRPLGRSSARVLLLPTLASLANVIAR